ncbi:hypothetical protein J2S43_002773 [Catenuloplanes nepalensis]|uniref:CATRA-Associated Small Protein domain-containing protein n=1 Tax=Catenuloplanes nepalensis TaxID=587533 RepID=A0ABT9MS45_9ACTN|nr:CATRA system-associated protein [Catenuloplanes nepalensis]MDP9794261.1 hypothetical protein [Catenuloplanes nepalensis]
MSEAFGPGALPADLVDRFLGALDGTDAWTAGDDTWARIEELIERARASALIGDVEAFEWTVRDLEMIGGRHAATPGRDRPQPPKIAQSKRTLKHTLRPAQAR